MIENLHWLANSGFRLDATKTVYFDPWKIPKDSKKADIIFISHDHFDHCSLPDIKRIAAADTVIVCDKATAHQLSGRVAVREVKALSPGDTVDVDGIRVEALPAYNLKARFHPRSSEYLGYLVDIEGARIYHAGDSDLVPEIKGHVCDLALLPVSGTYCMDAAAAAEAAIALKTKVAVPMHYGDPAGSAADAKKFQELLKGKVEVRILRKKG